MPTKKQLLNLMNQMAKDATTICEIYNRAAAELEALDGNKRLTMQIEPPEDIVQRYLSRTLKET